MATVVSAPGKFDVDATGTHFDEARFEMGKATMEDTTFLVDSGSLILPTDVLGCKLWLRSDLGITKDGSDNVSEWADQSGNGNDLLQATPANQPNWVDAQLSGYPAIRFNGTSDSMQSSAFSSLSQPLEVLVVAKHLGGGTGNNYLIDGNSNTMVIYNAKDGYLRAYAGAFFVGPAWDYLSWNLIDMLFYSTSSEARLNGGEPTTGNVGTYATTKFTLCAYGNGGQNGNYDLVEVIVYNAELSAPDRDNLEKYLNARYFGGAGISGHIFTATKSIVDEVHVGDAVIKNVTKPSVDGAHIGDPTRTMSITKPTADEVHVGDPTRILEITKPIADETHVGDAAIKNITKPIADVAHISDSQIKEATKVAIGEEAYISDTLAKETTKSVTDGIKVGDPTMAMEVTKPIADEALIGDAVIKNVTKIESDGFSIADILAKSLTRLFGDTMYLREPTLQGYWYRNDANDGTWRTIPTILDLLTYGWIESNPASTTYSAIASATNPSWTEVEAASTTWTQKNSASTSWSEI
jgi:hypothetical protein